MSWLGVDLDKTLAEYDKWRGVKHIGQPIVPMLKYVKELLSKGVDVRIFTARVAEGPEAVKVVEDWCEKYLGKKLPVTNAKDFSMVYMIDDRAFRPWDDDLPYPHEMARLLGWHTDPANPDCPPEMHAVAQADGDNG